MTKSDARPQKLQALSIFVGVWNTEGEIAATPDSPASKLLATDIYEWLPGRRFLVHRVDARMGDAVSRSIEIYEYDSDDDAFRSRSYDDQGVSEEFKADLMGLKWTIAGADLRFSGQFSEDENEMAGQWERRVGQAWAKLMDIRLRRAS
jgi:Protein of unknown function (DUF1579)